MAYESYADEIYYKNVYGGDVIADEFLNKALKTASRLADFESENADMIQSVLQQYAINGVSMTFGSSWNVQVQNGVAISRADYAFLCQSGLCCASLGV